jgi:hypothetical protein
MALGQHPQKHSPLILNAGAVSRYHHAIDEQSIARCDGARLSLDFDQAHPTAANWFYSDVVTKRWDLDTDRAGCFQNGEAFFKLVRSSIDYRFDQFQSFLVC